jgi:hypothetical protein
MKGLSDMRASVGNQALTEIRIGQEAFDGFGKAGYIVVGHQEAGLFMVDNLVACRTIGGHDRAFGGHCFNGWDTEPFVTTRSQKDMGLTQHGDLLCFVDPCVNLDVRLQIVCADEIL